MLTKTNKTERGASLVETSLLLALIAVIAVGGLTFVGKSANTRLQSEAAKVSTAGAQTTATTIPCPVRKSNYCHKIGQ